MTLESDTIQAVSDFTAYSIQTAAQAGTTPATNLTANILYASSSRKQGSFTAFYAMAQTKLAEDLLKFGKSVTDAQKARLYAYLIGAYQEAKDPDTFAKSVSFSGYSISRDGKSGYMVAYEQMLNSMPSTSYSVLPAEDEPVKADDSASYPDSWRLSGLGSAATESTYTDPF